ncbi:metallophosphoesterase family protein [Oceanispirochaeta crateris]|nr:metallophosphoesterase [Oceanispirochaeta crateris]
MIKKITIAALLGFPLIFLSCGQSSEVRPFSLGKAQSPVKYPELDIDNELYSSLSEKDLFLKGRSKIAHVSDVHHYARSLYDPASAGFEEFSRNNEGRTVLYTTEMMEILKADLLSRGVSTLLLSGDLSVLGTRATHEEMADILGGFEDDGIHVFITTGNHDINNPRAFRIVGSGTESVPSVTPEEFREIYEDFGFNEALLNDPTSLSYLVALEDDVLLLSLDSSYYQDNYHWGYSVARGGFNPEQYDFVLEALKRAEGKRVIMMSHHNLLRHYEIGLDLSNFMVNDENRMLNLLMDHGVKIGLSGHIHKSDIKEYLRGDNSFYGLTTGSLQIYPHSYRLIGWDDEELYISTADLRDNMLRDGQQAILNYNRDIGIARSYTGRYERLLEDASEEDARLMAEYFFLVNLYAQQGLEAYLPSSILQSGGLELLMASGNRMSGFARSLPLDSYPDDRNFRLKW